MLNWLVLYVESNKRTSGCCLNMSRVIRWRKRRDVSVIGGVPEGNRRNHNIVRVSSFASKELSWHERSGIVLVVLDIWKTQACPSIEDIASLFILLLRTLALLSYDLCLCFVITL